MRFTNFDGFGPDGRRVYRKGGGGDNGAEEMRAQEARRQAQIQQSMTGINEQFGKFDDSYFKNIADSFFAFQKPLYEEQLAEARRTLPFKYASTGNSEYMREAAALERDALRKEAELRDAGMSFANEQRGAVERDRADLVNLANAGTDANAVAQMAVSRSAAAAKPPQFSPIADLFQKYTAGIANASIANNQRVQRESPLLFNPGTKSVRTVG
jgi:hypothetical protein